MNFFTSPEDLQTWILSNESPNLAISKIAQVVGDQDLLSIKDGINIIFNLKTQTKKKENATDLDKDIEDASKSLFSVLAQYNIAGGTRTSISEGRQMNKKVDNEGEKVEKFNAADHFGFRKAQVTRPPSSPYTGREDSNKYEGTPWRKDRDSFYDFTHRNPDMLSFDDDPNRVYSGEAIWRRYIMDKFYRDYKDENGRLVGGYINDRFQTFHDLGGNQMGLANDERTRKPRPHQWSVERRLSDARGEETHDIDALTASDSIKFTKVAAKSIDKESDDVVQAFTDILDMCAAGLEEEDIISKVAEHYGMSMFKVADIKKFAYSMKEKFSGELYERESMDKTAESDDLKKKASNLDPAKAWKVHDEITALSVGPQNNILPTAGFKLSPNSIVFEAGVRSQNNMEVYLFDNGAGKETRFILEPNVRIENIADKMEDIQSDFDSLNGDDQQTPPEMNAGMSEQVQNYSGLENSASADFDIKES